MKKYPYGLIIGLALTVLAYTWHAKMRTPSVEKKYTIGIIQTASHPALDNARKGFLDTLNTLTDNAVQYIEYNAEGSSNQAHGQAQALASKTTVQGFYAIATPALQGCMAVEKDRPIIFSATTSIESFEPQKNVYGILDMPDIETELALIKKIDPTISSIAVLYNTAEINSLLQVNLIKKYAAKYELSIVEIGIIDESELPTGTIGACSKADALLCTVDNLTASAMSLIAKIALEHKKPLFACHEDAARQGALFARGMNYYQAGVYAAQIAYTLLCDPASIVDKIIRPKVDVIHVNKTAADALGYSITEELCGEKIIFV